MSVAANLAEVQRQIEKSGRLVCLVAVTKLKAASLIREAYKAGQRDFGENYVQELTEKISELSDLNGIRWHFIGSLQRNKCKAIVGKVHLIHSVDRIELAKEISKVAVQKGVRQDILLQVNLGDESTKSGCKPEDLAELLRESQTLEGVQVKGLMAMPPLSTNPEDGRPWFKRLRELRGKSNELSMGTSSDFSVAIEEGATIVRVGTQIFGERK